MINSKKEQKGITLIALVITIIVLLILAGVSISMISSQDGILNKATIAKETQKNATELERVKLAAQSALIDGEGTIDIADTTGTAKGSLKKALIEEFGSTSSVVTGYTAGKVTIGEKKYSVMSTGAVAEIKAQWTLTTDSGDKGVSVGDLVTSKKKTTEQFYVIGIDGDTVSLLSKYNLKSDGSEQDTTGASNGCAFSSINYWSGVSGIAYPDTTTGKYPDLNDETTYPKGNATSIVTTAEDYGKSLDVTGRLMTYEEANAFKNVNSTILYGKYSPVSDLRYWLGSAYSDDRVWIVYGVSDQVNSSYYYDERSFGVRPVVEVSRSSIE